jgi:ABC-type lipoprotein release transport system permease subunit
VAVPLSYSLRNIRVRWRLTLLAVVGITLVVAVFTVLMAMAEGFRAALRGSPTMRSSWPAARPRRCSRR